MPEVIYKLQPNRTLSLRGFDSLGASAALHSATASSFQVSGTFRDPADFAVLILHDADSFYEHPRLRYLPDTDFAGLTLAFDVQYDGLMPLDSPKFPTIDWPYLDVIRPDGTSARIRLSAQATQNGGSQDKATATWTIQDNGVKEFDRLTLWYLNLNFDYLAPKNECAYAFTAGGEGTVHRITVNGVDYIHTEGAGEDNTTVTTALSALVNAAPEVSATRTFNQIDLRAKRDDNQSFAVSSSASAATFTLTGIGPTTVAANLAAQINAVNWTASGVVLPLEATATGAALAIRSQLAGVDGNSITLYAVAKNNRLQTNTSDLALTGGTSGAIWRVTLDFEALGIPQVRQMWLTFAPPLAHGQALADTEWQATFTNWTLTGPEAKRKLQVAGPDSVRVEENDAWVRLANPPHWQQEVGFFSEGYARRSAQIGDQLTVRYACARPHDVYIGTSLYTDRAKVAVSLDGDTETELDCFLQNEPAVNTRRRVRKNVAPGEHTVTIRQTSAGYFYFDFLEAAVPEDVPAALPARPDISPALDYSTDHTYKLPPARILWMFDQLGFAGPMNEYIGVFWWNQRKRTGATIPAVTVVFDQTFAIGDGVFVNIGGQAIGKSVFPNEDNTVVAKHFAHAINATYVGVWASASGNTLTITVRSPTPAYTYTFTAWYERGVNSTTIPHTGSLQGGVAGTWEVDPLQTPALNRGARDWHRDFYAECHARDREITTACSMELVNPPAGFAAIFPDNQPVITSVGFGNLSSTHCAFNSQMLAYQKAVYAHLAELQDEAGLVPHLQMGEFLWWFFTNYHPTSNPNGGMAYYDAETLALAQSTLGRPLHVFRYPTDDPAVNSHADAIVVRNILRDYASQLRAHVAAPFPNAKFELLFPYDVNHPEPVGVFELGGALNRYVNFPAEWEQKSTSPFDNLKMEALDFGAWSRNLDLARKAIRFPIDLGWPKDSIRYLVPIFRPASAWQREYVMARAEGHPFVNLWAYDHICLYGLDVKAPSQPARVGASD